ncbi:MAG: hypothetical protein ACRERD_20020 [Candidatus Binatia bacterium]
MMQAVYSLFIAALLMIGTLTTASAQQWQATPDWDCEQGVQAAEPNPEGVSVLLGVVTKIDHAKSTIALQTDVGNVELIAEPEDLKDVKEGDTLVVFMEEEQPLEQQIA